MSVERVVRSNGEVVWRVRWREGSRNRSRVLGRKRDADAFDAEVRRRRRTGELAALDAGRETLAQFAETWWQLYALPNLAPRTRASYAHIWDRHVLPRLGALPLREIDTLVVGRLAADLEHAGVGPAARRKALAVLSGVLQRAVEWGKLPSNPARAVRSPSARRARAVRPLPPVEVEGIREQLLASGRLRDATLVSVLAYVGPRPAEALGLRWEDVGERSLTFHATKTRSRRIRAAHLVAPVRGDLATWRLASERPSGENWVFPRTDGGRFTDDDYRNWRVRVFAPACHAAAVPGAVRPYDLRHSAASLWLHEGRSVIEVAAWLGHAPTMTLDTYAHLVAELVDGPRRSAEAEIKAARARVGTRFVPLTRGARDR